MKLFCTVIIILVVLAVVQAADEWADKRAKLVQIVRSQGVVDPKVLAAMSKVPRHLFVAETYRDQAYNDYPLPIGQEQTISQPFIVGFMTQALRLKGSEKVLEIGTGSGYQAAILGEIAKQVYTIEIICELADRAGKLLQAQGYKNITVKCGDGYQGWKEHAPFDAIIVTAAPDHVPQPLIDQLAEGGRMIVPVGRFFQDLILLEKNEGRVTRKSILPVAFVPMTGPGVQH